MLKLPVYFISDNHFKMDIDNSEKERRGKLYHVFDQIKSTGGTLVIGGDFFDFWFNYQYVVPSGYINLLEQLDNLGLDKVVICTGYKAELVRKEIGDNYNNIRIIY